MDWWAQLNLEIYWLEGPNFWVEYICILQYMGWNLWLWTGGCNFILKIYGLKSANMIWNSMDWWAQLKFENLRTGRSTCWSTIHKGWMTQIYRENCWTGGRNSILKIFGLKSTHMIWKNYGLVSPVKFWKSTDWKVQFSCNIRAGEPNSFEQIYGLNGPAHF